MFAVQWTLNVSVSLIFVPIDGKLKLDISQLGHLPTVVMKVFCKKCTHVGKVFSVVCHKLHAQRKLIIL